jgi:hypothetical protein
MREDPTSPSTLSPIFVLTPVTTASSHWGKNSKLVIKKEKRKEKKRIEKKRKEKKRRKQMSSGRREKYAKNKILTRWGEEKQAMQK